MTRGPTTMTSGPTKKTPGFIRGVHRGDSFDNLGADDPTQAEAGDLGMETGLGDGGAPPPSDPGARRLAAKRHNEGVKLFATGMNTLAAAVLTTAVIFPLIKDPVAFVIEYRPVWYFVGIGLHIAGQIALRSQMLSED